MHHTHLIDNLLLAAAIVLWLSGWLLATRVTRKVIADSGGVNLGTQWHQYGACMLITATAIVCAVIGAIGSHLV